jgi:hypothetical protein
MGINDCIVVYYFATKDELVGEVLVAMDAELQATLAPAISTPVGDHVELLQTVWPLLAHPATDPVSAFFFEANGLAVTGRELYRTILTQLVDGWIQWDSEFIERNPDRRCVETAIALIDGVLFLLLLAGPEAAA